MVYVLSVDRKLGVIATDSQGRVTILSSVTDYLNFLSAEANRLNRSVDSLEVYNSSTMHFPEDSTDDPTVIALVNALDG